MNLFGRTTFALAALAFALPAFSQSLRMRTRAPYVPPKTKEVVSPWSLSLSYSVLTDYADTRTPRSYNNSMSAGLGYEFSPNWSLGADAGISAESVNGQVYKNAEQSYEEVLNARTSVSVSYGESFFNRHKYSFSVSGQPLWDEPSRLEGYKGIVGGGASLSLAFFDKAYTLINSLAFSELINTYKYGSDSRANPNYFVTYGQGHSFKLFEGFKFSTNFGIQATHYLDNFWGYSYQSTFTLSKSWRGFGFSLSYHSGGFTDDGQVVMWYLNQYRRIARFGVSYAF